MFSVILSRYLAKLDAADSADEISGVIEDFLLQFDIYMFSAALVKNTRLENDDVQWMSNTTQAHFEEYMSENRIHDDYGIRRNATGNDFTPFFIGDEFVSETPDILDNEIDFYKYNASLGYRSGVAVPLKTKVEGLPAGFSLWSEMNKAQFERLMSSHSNEILLFLLMAQRKVESALFIQAHNVDLLTNRERDCLSLIARGMRPDQIGDHLCIATVTANYHIRMARKKLSARTNAEAVAKAISYSLL